MQRLSLPLENLRESRNKSPGLTADGPGADHYPVHHRNESQAVLDLTPIPIRLVDRDGRVEFANRAWMLSAGVAREATTWENLLARGVREEGKRQWFAAFESRKPYQIAFAVARTDGQHLHLTEVGQPRLGQDGVFQGAGTIRALESRLNEAGKPLPVLDLARMAGQAAGATHTESLSHWSSSVESWLTLASLAPSRGAV
ncbi:MAG: hypothetical protein FJW40_00240 [Acidobacteria bacterium]|nr:hypothetical protein [Acidobacteriota bacterium]